MTNRVPVLRPVNRRTAVALALTLALSPSSTAGGVSPVVIGSVVRVSAPSIATGKIQGAVVEIDDQALLISVKDSGPLRVPREMIRKLEVSLGSHGHAMKGMLIGTLVGGAVGVADVDCDCPGQDHAMGAVGGALGGLVIGALIRSDRWATVPIDQVHAR